MTNSPVISQEFLTAVARGLADIEEGRTVSLAEARKRLGLEEAETQKVTK